MASPLSLASRLKVGRMDLAHRLVLPPLTRYRATAETLAPNDMMIEYYKQRTTKGGLLISEATAISPETIGANNAPGIWTPAQVAGWKQVTSAIHAKGGYMFCQLWHVGRGAHDSFNAHHLVRGSGYQVNRSASDVPQEGTTHMTLDGTALAHVKPVPLTLDEIARLREDYTKAAKNAIEAGFDGVELHSANAYLLDQFLNSETNHRTDRYGGSVANRTRLLDEVLGDLCSAVGRDRVAVRLSPHRNAPPMFFGLTDADPVVTYRAAFATAARHKLAYTHVSESSYDPTVPGAAEAEMQFPRAAADLFHASYVTDPTDSSTNADNSAVKRASPVIGAGGYTPVSAARAVETGVYDLVAMGRFFISNPDLPHRVLNGLPLTDYDRHQFYTPAAAEGYIDYPTFAQVCAALGAREEDYLPAKRGAAAAARAAGGGAVAVAAAEAEERQERAALDAKIDALVARHAQSGAKYPLVSSKSIGVSTSSAARKKTAAAAM